MVEVLIVNDENNNLGYEIYSVLSEKNSCMLISGNSVLKNCEIPDVLLIENKNFSNIELCDYILILGTTGLKLKNSYFNNAHTVVVSSDNQKGLRIAKELDSQILICGMSVRDTVTVTSVVGESVTVSINRSLKNLNNAIVEESEAVFPNKGVRNFSLMCAGIIGMLK